MINERVTVVGLGPGREANEELKGPNRREPVRAAPKVREADEDNGESGKDV